MGAREVNTPSSFAGTESNWLHERSFNTLKKSAEKLLIERHLVGPPGDHVA